MLVPIKQKPLNEMKYPEMVTEIRNVRKVLKDRFIDTRERTNLHKYVRRLEREVYDYETFRNLPHTFYP